MKKGKKIKILVIVGVCFFILSSIMLYKGYDKMTNYYNSEYSSRTVNAYVGGDAYNYIINSNYATGFFVLAVGLFLAGSLFTTTAVVISSIPETSTIDIRKPESIQELAEQLPEL